MTVKRFIAIDDGFDFMVRDIVTGDNLIDADGVADVLNDYEKENEQLKKDRFICLDCKHSGYAEIGCLCEKKDHWTDYKTECKDYEELE